MQGLEVQGGLDLATRQPAAQTRLENAGVYVFLIAFLSLYYLSNASILLGHLDLGWHLAAGDLIRAQRAIPYQDTWSFTLGDKQWFNVSWLWDVIASVIHQYSGFGGLVLSVVACGALIAGGLTYTGLHSGASAQAVCVSVFAACLLYPTFATDPNSYLSASPNTATMLLGTFFYVVCLARMRLVLLPAAMMLWANLHGGFVLGFAILGAFGVEAIVERDVPRIRNLGVAGIACLAAIFVNPLGWHIVEGIAATLGHFVQTEISEWQPYHRVMKMPGNLPAIAWMLLFVGLELAQGRKTPMPRAPRWLAWAFLALGLYQFRYMSFFFIFATVPIALHLDRLLSRSPNAQFQKMLMMAGIAGLCALPLSYLQVRPAFGLTDMLSPADARYLREHYTQSRLLNHWNVGGTLIYLTQGSVPVFVDGRAATAYPDDLLRDYLKLVNLQFDEAAWDDALTKYKIDAVLWVKAHDALRQYLVGKKGWKEAYAGRYETVYVRP